MQTTTPTLAQARRIIQSLVQPVNAVLIARAAAAVERERMDALNLELFADLGPFKDRHGETITDPKQSYRMAECYRADYYAERDRRIRALGYDMPEGHCPTLAMETVRLAAERVLIEAAEPLVGLTWDRMSTAKIEHFRAYIENLCGLVVNSPDYRAICP